MKSANRAIVVAARPDRQSRGSSASPAHAIAFGPWLIGVMTVFLLSHWMVGGAGGFRSQVARLVSLVWPTTMLLISRRFRVPLLSSESRVFVSLFALLAGALVASLLNTPSLSVSASYISVTLVVILIAFSFGGVMSDADYLEALRKAAKICILGGSVLGLALQHGQFGQDADTLNRNTVGFLLFLGFAGSLLQKNRAVRSSLVALFALLMLRSGSRGGLFAATIVAGSLLILPILPYRGSMKRGPLLIKGVPLVAAIVVLLFYWDQTSATLAEIFAIWDRSRGFQGGLSGRTVRWTAALAIFRESPLLGVGVYMHEMFMPSGGAVHNGYLMTLVETGIVGASGAGLLLSFGLFGLWRRRESPAGKWGLAVSMGLLGLAFFESFLLNVGHPGAFLLLVLTSRGAANPPKAKPGEASLARLPYGARSQSLER